MKPSQLLSNCMMILFLTGNTLAAPLAFAAPTTLYAEATVAPESTPSPAATATKQATPFAASTATPAATPATEAFAMVDVAARIRENLLSEKPTLKLIAMGSAIFLYPEPTTKSTKIKLRNENVRKLNELIVLDEVTSPEGTPFYHVRSAFSPDTGYVLVKDAKESRLAGKGIPGFAKIEAAAAALLITPEEKAPVLAKECEHLVRILGELDGYYYVITEAGNFGYVLPSQVTRITLAEVNDRIARAEAPAVKETMRDPMMEASAANAAKMLRAGADSAAVHYWTTAEAHVAQQGWLKKATIAMLSVAAGSEITPVGYEGIQFRSCPEVTMLEQGESLQRGLDFNLHGSLYSDSPITSVNAEMVPSSGAGAAIRQSVTFLPKQNITAYSLTSRDQEALDKKFDIRKLRAGQYHFTLTATSVSHPEPITLVSVDCGIVSMKHPTLTRNKFDDNYLDALEFFQGETTAFLFPYYIGDGRGIGTDPFWRDAHIVRSDMGRVHIDAVPNFETAYHYLNDTYVRVSLFNARTGKLLEGDVLLLDELMDKCATYVPRFQSNLEYLSHHTLGTAADVNDNMFPNANIPRNHDLIGGEVRNHLVYNGIKTDEKGTRYYDFTYDGLYPARYKKVPTTIINYLLYELAFYRAGFEWGFYYETTCDAMHFMLTENDKNRHMHTDIGLRKVYEYIEPDWVYVPTPSPSPVPARTPKLKPTATPKPTPKPKGTPSPTPSPKATAAPTPAPKN